MTILLIYRVGKKGVVRLKARGMLSSEGSSAIRRDRAPAAQAYPRLLFLRPAGDDHWLVDR